MPNGISLQDLMMEVRDDLSELKASFADFKGRVVMKDELELWQETNRTTRRWAIGIVLTILAVSVSAVTVLMSMI